MKIFKKKRKFTANKRTNLIVTDIGKITLKSNEHLTIKSNNKNHEICAMSWGFYATSSLNSRLKREGFKTYLVRNFYKKIFILMVNKKKENSFKKYCISESLKIIKRLDTIK